VLYLLGGLLMAYNVYRTIRGDLREEVVEGAPARGAVAAE
jgi:cytochrome c oxidase cbb3-type subunit 1